MTDCAETFARAWERREVARGDKPASGKRDITYLEKERRGGNDRWNSLRDRVTLWDSELISKKDIT